MGKQYVLGIDVSTSCTGYCVLDRNIEPNNDGSHVVLMGHTSFKKCKTIWEKADEIGLHLSTIRINNPDTNFLVVVEEPLMGFRTGMSSAATIASLLRFNGIVAFQARNLFDIDPQYVMSQRARKTCGMKMQKPSICGRSHKQQVFDHMTANDLKFRVWETKKSGQPVDSAFDETDAYVMARAGCLLNK